MLYVSFMVFTKQKLIDKEKRKRKEFKHTTIEYHQNTKEDSMRGRKGKKRIGTRKQPGNNEQNGSTKSICMNNYFKYLWIKFSNQNIQNGSVDKKQHPTNYTLLQETHFNFKNTCRLKVKNIPRKLKPKKAEVAIFISDKIDFKPKTITRDTK